MVRRSSGVEGKRLPRCSAVESPRERLLRCGGRAVSDAELIAVLLGSGRPGLSALEMAAEVIADSGGLWRMAAAEGFRFRRPGIGNSKMAKLLAAFELGRRLARARVPRRTPLEEPGAIARYLSLRYSSSDQEIMGALFLDVRSRLIGEREIYRGTLSRAAVEPRGILKEALLHSASGFLLWHTHPSSDPAPSQEDIHFTKRIAEAGEVVGIRLVDHLILGGGGRWLSLQRRKFW